MRFNVFSFSQDLTDRDKLMIFYEDRLPEPTHIDNLAAKHRIPIKAIQYRLYILDSANSKEVQKIRNSIRKHLGEHGVYTSSLESFF